MEVKRKVVVLPRATFSFDDERLVHGYALPQHWNGWACPAFPKEQIMDWCQRVGVASVSYEPTNCAITIQWSNDQEPETFNGQQYMTVDGPRMLFPVGAFAWTWSSNRGWKQDLTNIKYPQIKIRVYSTDSASALSSRAVQALDSAGHFREATILLQKLAGLLRPEDTILEVYKWITVL